MLDTIISPDQLEAAKRAAINGDYHLLLGAGASLEAKSPSGAKLPGGAELANRISTEFDVPIESGDFLWRIYERATTKHGSEPVYGWLRSIFHLTVPPDWMESYARIPWDTVWTLNIDDAFETSYAGVQTDVSRALMTHSWDDDYRVGRFLSVVHLHGHVAGDDPRSLVFSLSEYAGSAAAHASWPAVFRDTYGVNPFVIIGARLRDEPDIEAVVAQRRPEHDAPSLYVSPHITDATAGDLRSWNLIPVKMTAEDFALEWAILTELDLSAPPSHHEEIALRVGRQFIELHTNSFTKVPKDHDFLGGDPPRWGDIVERRHAEVDWIRQGEALIKALGRSGAKTSLLMFAGQRLSGRSTGLLALARIYRQASWRVFQFRAEERLDIDAIIHFAADGKPLLLVFDGISELADDIEVLLDRARRSGLRVSCLAVEHSRRSAAVLGRVNLSYFVGSGIKSINSRLTKTDAARLVDNLSRAGRLGVLEPLADPQRLRHFRGHELFPALAEVEDAPGFGKRVKALVDDLDTDREVLDACFLAAVASRVDRTLYLIDAARMLQKESEEILRLSKDSRAGGLIYSDGQRLLTRQRWMALQPLVQKIGVREAMERLAIGVSRLGRRANRSAYREKNATVLLVGSLMTYRNLIDLFPGENLESWYSSLVGSFGNWSGRFWEQRAIMSRHLGATRTSALAQAESYAARAVSLRPDPFSYTTFATVLAVRASVADRADVMTYYERAYDAYEMASSLDSRNVITWIAYLQHALPILVRLSATSAGVDESQERVADDWLRIHDQISVIASASEDTQNELVSLWRRYQSI